MTIITSREFRSNQSKYFTLANKGEDVILKSRVGSFRILPVTKDDTLMSKTEYLQMLKNAENQIAAGKSTKIASIDELNSFLESL